MSITTASRAALTAALICATATACGSDGNSNATYAPAAYGVQAGSAYDCYYVDVPAEVVDLESAGLCPAHSIAVRAPVTWEATYWGYYSSPAYYNTYMPASARSSYTKTTIVSFSKTYSSQISADEPKATYKSSSGQKVTGTSKLKFGAGSSGTSGGSAVHGGGSARNSCSESMTTVQGKSGTSGSSSHGGGSARSGGSSSAGSSAKTGSGSHGGC